MTGMYERGVRECRCGMEVAADVAAMLAHFDSDEHAARIAAQHKVDARLQRKLWREYGPPNREGTN